MCSVFYLFFLLVSRNTFNVVCIKRTKVTLFYANGKDKLLICPKKTVHFVYKEKETIIYC